MDDEFETAKDEIVAQHMRACRMKMNRMEIAVAVSVGFEGCLKYVTENFELQRLFKTQDPAQEEHPQ